MPPSRYGTVDESAAPLAVPKGPARPADVEEEQQSLLPATPSRPSFRAQFTADIQRDYADVVLLSCYVITGLLDSASISIWGSFVSMQTGNTVYVGLGLSKPTTSTRLPRSGISILAFCIGSFLFSRFHRRFGPRRRWVLCASFITQFALCLSAALVVTLAPPDRSSGTTVRWNDIVPIGLVALQSCGQAVASRALKYNALTSVVLTSIYCDLFSDQDLFKRDNIERNRRGAAPILVLIGAVMGGIFAASSFGIAGALWTATLLKACVIVTWWFWPAENDD